MRNSLLLLPPILLLNFPLWARRTLVPGCLWRAQWTGSVRLPIMNSTMNRLIAFLINFCLRPKLHLILNLQSCQNLFGIDWPGETRKRSLSNAILKSQKLLCGALMPLLSVIDSLDSKYPNQKLLASAIQVLFSANLKLSKTRRGAVRPLVKPELRSILCDQKVSHLYLFRSDYDKCTKTASKAHFYITKVLLPPPPPA